MGAIVGSWCRFTLLDREMGEGGIIVPMKPGDPRAYVDVLAQDEAAAKAEEEAKAKAEKKKKAKAKKGGEYIVKPGDLDYDEPVGGDDAG